MFSLKRHFKVLALVFTAGALVLSASVAMVACNPTVDSQGNACIKSCNLDKDCGGLGQVCQANQCQQRGTFCVNDLWAMNDRGETTICGAYKCEPTLGACKRSADSSNDCTSGFVFNGQQACVPAVTCQPGGDPSPCVDAAKERNTYEIANQPPTFKTDPACVESCKLDKDCAAGNMCYSGKCQKAENFCQSTPNGWIVVEVSPSSTLGADGNLKHTVTSCGNFSCDPVRGACQTDCQSSSDCSNQLSCSNGVCE